LAPQRHAEETSHGGAYASWQEVGLRRKTALVAAGISVTVSAALVVRVIAINKPGVVLILAPAIVGSLLALWHPDHRGFLYVAAALNALTAGVSLIGGVGLLYVPSIVLLIWSAIPKSAPQAT
jgi:hypothetical protein